MHATQLQNRSLIRQRPLAGVPSGAPLRFGVCTALVLIFFGADPSRTMAQFQNRASPNSAEQVPGDDATNVLSAVENATITAIAKAEQSVVAIARVPKNRQPNARSQFGNLQLSIPLSFADPHNDPDFVPTFFGSGVVISDDGFIVTCAHVLDDPREYDYYVWLNQLGYPAQVQKVAKVSASDPFSDLAVLRIDAAGLKPIEFSDPATLKKGRFVIALGNPDAIARDGRPSAMWGIISNLSRVAPSERNENAVTNKETIHEYGTLIQTDASLRLGTSGGALIDMQGKMVGLTTSLAAREGTENAAGFAIATDALFQRVVESLKLGRLPEYGFLGIQPEDLLIADRQQGRTGARVGVVIPGLPGDRAGLRANDVIIQVNEKLVHNRNQLFRELSVIPAGDEVEMLVERYRPRSNVPTLQTLTAQVSKKYVATKRPGFATDAPPAWRGLAVEYSTAIPSELTRSGILNAQRGTPKVAVLSVEPGTAAWNSGIRAGYGIRSLDGKNIESPDAFHNATGSLDRAAKLLLVLPGGTEKEFDIPANE